MDDLYSNLDNYEDVHALEELRAENKELKEKLAENSTAMAKLQKDILQDYDNLEMAFKTLEHNYSSLLITARAELLRKTQRINQLNTEKDLMVLDAFKSGKNIRRNFNTGVKNPGRMLQDRAWNGNKKTKEDNDKQKNVAVKQESRETLIVPKNVADPDSGTFNRNKPDNTGVKVELSNSRKSNVSDNISQHKTERNGPPRTTTRSIKDRRKSTPAVSMPIDTFSSCDEQGRNYSTKETRTDNVMRNINKLPIDSNQSSETSSVDDRGHKHYESSRDSYKSRLSRYHDKSSYRGWDKDEVSLKYKKQHSPERGQKRPHREHQDGYPKQHREHPDGYPKQHREHPDGYPKQHREHPDGYPKQHRERLDDMQSMEHKDDYPRQSREYKDNYPKQHGEHLNDHLKQHRERLDDMQSREHKDNYPRQSREYKDDYPKQHREHPNDHLKQHRERLDDNQSRDHKDGYPRQSREYKDDYPRQERGRFQGKSLESPPPESYSHHQRRKSTHRPDYDRYPHNQEKNRYSHDDEYSAKLRSKDSDEPLIKRQRRESHGNPDAQCLDDRRPYRERESVDAQPTPDFSPHEQDMLRFSCQSPDYIHTEEVIANPIKEIKATAATPLDDPRLTSKRYVIQNESGKETLSTMVGRNIDIIPVNKVKWNIKPVGMPAALVRRPSHCSDLLVKDIYMDIDNPGTHLDESMESGELRETGDEIHEVRGKLKKNQHNTQDFKISKQKPEQISKQPINAEPVSKPNIAKYRISKIGQSNKNTHNKMDVPIIDLGENVPYHQNIPHHRNINLNKKAAGEDSVSKELLPHRQQYNKRDDFVADSKYNSKQEGRTKSKSRERSESQYQSTLTKMAIVADDLELSDDTSDHMDTNKRVIPEKVQKHCEMALQMNEVRSIDSDHMDTNKRVIPEKVQKHCEMALQMNEVRNIDSVNSVENGTVASSHITEIKSTVKTAGITDEEKVKESDSTKKQKNKKKKSKSKEIFKDSVDSTADPIHVLEKKSKSKKEKEGTPKETKDKFCDLFGDSNSLMTPEDLGIPSYLPISEDTQDAVDMKINQIIDATPLVDKDKIPGHILTPNTVEVTKQKTTAHDDILTADLQKSNTNVEDKEVIHEIKKNTSAKTNEEVIDTNQLPSPIIHENLNPGADLNDPNVVKTIIISTGIQPEIAFENGIQVTKPDTVVKVDTIENTKDIHCLPATTEFKKDILKALATSTPHKEFSAMNPLEADAAKTDVICDPCVSQAVATITNVEPVVNRTENNTLESNDAPDIRIFVKRRRKVVKRPPMN